METHVPATVWGALAQRRLRRAGGVMAVGIAELRVAVRYRNPGSDQWTRRMAGMGYGCWRDCPSLITCIWGPIRQAYTIVKLLIYD